MHAFTFGDFPAEELVPPPPPPPPKVHSAPPKPASWAAMAQRGVPQADSTSERREEEKQTRQVVERLQMVSIGSPSAAGRPELAMSAREDGGEDAALRAAIAMLGRRGWSDGPAHLTHRGLMNTGNACFRSAILQALLALESFASTVLAARELLNDPIAAAALPTWAELCRFAAAFEEPVPGGGGSGVAALSSAPATVSAAAAASSSIGSSGGGGGGGGAWASVQRTKGKKGGRSGFGASLDAVVAEDALATTFAAFRGQNPGQQEDAHEFFAFLIDRLHEELVTARKAHSTRSSRTVRAIEHNAWGTPSGGGDAGAAAGVGAADHWQEVGKGGTRAVVNNPVALEPSVVTSLFYGWLRSEVRKGGSATLSVSLEPFQCLQLDLEPAAPPPSVPPPGTGRGVPLRVCPAPAMVGAAAAALGPGRGRGRAQGRGAWNTDGAAGAGRGRPAVGAAGTTAGAPMSATGAGPRGGAGSVHEALAAFFSGEVLDGVKGGHNVEVKALKSVSLDRLPHFLTLHLKQFFFDQLRGPRKLCKPVLFPTTLEIPATLLSASLRAKHKTRPPRYCLRSVIYHHGRFAHGGHYTTCCRDRHGTWRHFDDDFVNEETEHSVLRPPQGHPYLLIYEEEKEDAGTLAAATTAAAMTARAENEV